MKIKAQKMKVKLFTLKSGQKVSLHMSQNVSLPGCFVQAPKFYAPKRPVVHCGAYRFSSSDYYSLFPDLYGPERPLLRSAKVIAPGI